MRLMFLTLCAGALVACGGSTPEPPKPVEPLLYRTVIEAEGIPFEVSWDRNDRTRATARVFGVPEELAIDPSNVVTQATGCRVTDVPSRVPSTDGVATYMADIDCAPAEVLSAEEEERSRELAREIDLALNQLSVDRSPVPLETAVSGVKTLFEGSPFSAFDADDIERYCAEPWETRVGADGRTEYNPCKRRDAFR